MTNFEKFKDEIKEITENNIVMAVVDGKPCKCMDIRCYECDLHNAYSPCGVKLLKWLQEEYIEPCPFEKDELVEVSNDGKFWYLRYFSYMQENGLYSCFCNQEKSDKEVSTMSWKYCRKYGTLGGFV